MLALTKHTHFEFMAKRKYATILSTVLLIIALFAIFSRGLNFGIDFTGGTVIEAEFNKKADLTVIRQTIADNDLGDAQVQYFGENNKILIRVAPKDNLKQSELSTKILDSLKSVDDSMIMRRVEFVGPQVGKELTEDGGLAVLFAMMAILIYVWLRFEWRFSVSSVVAIVHDVVITVGFFALLQLKFDLPVLAAVLAVIGYSLNDTIVVFDRIRENFRKMRKGSPSSVIDHSLNQTLSRTLMTSLTTLLVLVSLFLLGGEIIHGFAIALIVGVIIGTYSSIYVASNTALSLGVSKEDLDIPTKESVGK